MNATTKNAAISIAIAQHVAAGKALPEAMDAVLGAGTYASLAGSLYDALRSKAAK